MMSRFNYFWRLGATALCFASFGVGGLVLGGVVFPLIFILPGSAETQRRRIRGAIQKAFRFFFQMMHFLGILRYRVVGAEKIVQDRGFMVIANHPTLIDVISLISLYPNASCIVKKELWNNFFMKRVVDGAGYIPNDDPEKLLKYCEENFARGDVLIVFPEGTRTIPGQEIQMKRGAAHVALKLRCPIRTIRIDVKPMMLTKNQSWYQIPRRRADFTVTINSVIPVDEFPQNMPQSLSSRHLTRRMLENIALTSP